MLALAQAVDLTIESNAQANRNTSEKQEPASNYSPACMAVHAQIRALVPMLKEDRSMSGDIATIASLISTRDPSGDAQIFMF
jgi:histidine ammonia-lyase